MMKKKRSPLEGYQTYDTSNGFGSREEWRQNFYDRMSDEEAVRVVSDDSPYSILGVSQTATFDEVKAAYRKLIAEWHPDVNKSPEATAMSQKIIAAYTILKKKLNR